MIDPKELRINNIISFKELWNGRVCEVTPYIINIYGNTGVLTPDLFYGISLTPELLIKLGYVKYRYWWSGSDNTFVFEEWTRDGFGLYLCVNAIKLGIHMKYLHQLQNIYFALTNKELEINL